jgi:hypothetical protein
LPLAGIWCRPVSQRVFLGARPVLAEADLQEHQEQGRAEPRGHQRPPDDLAGQSTDKDGAEHARHDHEGGRPERRDARATRHGSNVALVTALLSSLAMAEGRGRKRISRRTLSSPATVEAYLQAGVVPRFIERANQIESDTRRHRRRLQRAYDRMRERYADNPERFADRWRAMAERWRFDGVNELIAQHNEWYPMERRLPLNPRTGDYVTAGGRDWRRRPLDAEWVLEQFPPPAV